ncbi:hypothetical protein WMY93_028762 [Mugilogobius chulae]|uniref:G-protein coupled receptors family 1 profile domain-containing protein n=1 Tax=Mugilogobius chulae TaxID=88201 RepID=A0AAW0N1J8_9GOBI
MPSSVLPACPAPATLKDGNMEDPEHKTCSVTVFLSQEFTSLDCQLELKHYGTFETSRCHKGKLCVTSVERWARSSACICSLQYGIFQIKQVSAKEGKVQQVWRQNVLGIFLLCLSISDLLFVFTMPLWINYYNQDHHWKLGATSCSIAGFFYYSNMYISIFLLCCISVDRCLVVIFPLRSKTHRTSSCAWIQCLGVYAIVTILHVMVLIFDDLKDAHDEENNNDRCYETYPMTKNVGIFNLLRVGIGFVLPLLILVLSYWKILATVDQSPGLNLQAKRKGPNNQAKWLMRVGCRGSHWVYFQICSFYVQRYLARNILIVRGS